MVVCVVPSVGTEVGDAVIVDALADAVGDAALVTVTVVVPLCPSQVAVIVAVPTATGVTTPVAGETVATDALELCQLTTRPVIRLPSESLVTAVN